MFALPPLYPTTPTAPTAPTPVYSGPSTSDNGKVVPQLYTYIFAVVGYLAVISFMPPKGAAALSILLILGALYVNQKSRGGLSIFDTLGLPNSATQ